MKELSNKNKPAYSVSKPYSSNVAAYSVSKRMWTVVRVMTLVLSLFALGSLVACGSNPKDQPIAAINPKAPGACYSVLNGKWKSVLNAQYNLVLTDTCLGASTYCNESFTINPQANGSYILLVTATNGGPECLPLGATTCTTQVLANQNNNQISISCNKAGAAINTDYNRQ